MQSCGEIKCMYMHIRSLTRPMFDPRSPHYLRPMQRLKVLSGTILVLAASFLAPADALGQGCAMCKAVVESSEGGVFGGRQEIGAGLNTGILYLMAVPYVLLFLLFRKRIFAFFRELSSAQG
jgi:hypothetical protein